MTRVSGQPTVYHADTMDISWQDLEPLPQYRILRITPDNAEEFGYPTGSSGLKIQYNREPVADATSLADAVARIAEHLAATLVLVEDAIADTRCWEPASPGHNHSGVFLGSHT